MARARPSKPGADSIIRELRSIADGGHRVGPVLRDWCAMASSAFANCCMPRDDAWEAREAEYMRLVGVYGAERVLRFSELLGELAMAYYDDPTEDHLGLVFERLEQCDPGHGQFFTPMHVCALLAEMTLQGIDEHIAERGYITVLEPAAGAGRMILAAANVLRRMGHDPATCMVATLVDVDSTCYHMSHITTSLAGIPAQVIHGNALSLQQWASVWTPAYAAGAWFARGTLATIERVAASLEQAGARPTIPTAVEAADEPPPLVYQADSRGQLLLI